MKKLFLIGFLLITAFLSKAQQNYEITNFEINVFVNQDASLDVSEKIYVHFDEPYHGIYRDIPFKYPQTSVQGNLKANAQLVSNGKRYTIIENIKVKHFDFDVNTNGNYKSIKIGSKDKTVGGDQVYEISYRLVGAINFFDHFSELYLNLTGNEWKVPIEKSSFQIHFYKALPDSTDWFVSTGSYGSRENFTETKSIGDSILTGQTTRPLGLHQGITIGVRMPENYLKEPDLKWRDKGWLVLPLIVFFIMLFIWKKWGKDLPYTVRTEFYPPENVSPSVAGYVIDGTLDKRDLTALVPYWGAGGYLKVKEIREKKLLGLIKSTEYEFTKLKDLNADAYSFEKTMFDGLFESGDTVLLSDLKNSFYSTMNKAKAELESEIKKEHYYVRYTRTAAVLVPIFAGIILVISIINLLIQYPIGLIIAIAVSASALIIFIFGALMSKKTEKGTELYAKLLGFREFIKSVEKDRLKEFLKQDENYFDKVLPYAIVFDVADKWKDKLEGLDIPPPSWYTGYYPGSAFNAAVFMSSIDHSMQAMSQNFYSAPSGSSGTSGGSFGGGGFSGGGFGGGGGGGW